MWTRKELKDRAKVAFKANYWKCVLVSLILGLLIGGGAGSSVRRNDTDAANAEQQSVTTYLSELDDSHVNQLLAGVQKITSLQNGKYTLAMGGLGLVGLALSILLFNPLIVGCYRFFLQNSRGGAELGELGAGFRGDWGNVVLTMFLRNLFLILWALLFIIPGIIKGYAYRMVPYILKEHPEMKGTQAITLSKKMMQGHKGEAFLLDLSFIGWFLLSALTLGILHLFYVGPYYQATDAELYKVIYANYMAQQPQMN